MPHTILGLHHVTATVDDAQQDLDFCLDLLGLRLVKKTVKGAQVLNVEDPASLEKTLQALQET